MCSSPFPSLDGRALAVVTGGEAAPPSPAASSAGLPQRTWTQVAREYAGACFTGAGQSTVFGGRPTSVRMAITNAAIGCATGMGLKVLMDGGAMIAGKL